MITQPHRLMTAEPNGSKQVRWSHGLSDHTSGLGLLGLAVMSRYHLASACHARQGPLTPPDGPVSPCVVVMSWHGPIVIAAHDLAKAQLCTNFIASSARWGCLPSPREAHTPGGSN